MYVSPHFFKVHSSLKKEEQRCWLFYANRCFCDSGPSCVDAKGDIVAMLHILCFSHLLGPKPALNVKCILKPSNNTISLYFHISPPIYPKVYELL